jgi:hypothetical protein
MSHCSRDSKNTHSALRHEDLLHTTTTMEFLLLFLHAGSFNYKFSALTLWVMGYGCKDFQKEQRNSNSQFSTTTTRGFVAIERCRKVIKSKIVHSS